MLASQSLLASPERCVNLYSQRVGQEYKLYPTPGLATFRSAPESPGRGIFSHTINGTERCFATIGPTEYEVNADGTTTSRGTVAVDGNPSTHCTNGDAGDQLFITSGDTGYILNLNTNVLTSVVSDVTMGGYMDERFLALDGVTSTLKISNALDGTTWDGTQIAQRSTASDPWKAMLVKYPRIFLIGDFTGDVWYNAGNSPFPFAPITGVQIPYGIAAPFSLKRCGAAIMWLTHNKNGDGQVVEALGYNPTVVSTEPVEQAISKYSRINDAVGWSYQDQGHDFYVLNFPSANATWVYDRTEGMWHERASWDGTMFTAWGPQYHTHVFNRHLVLHAGNGTTYRMASDLYTDADGDVLRRMRIPPILADEQKRLFVDRLQLHLEPGLGLTSGQGSDPSVLMRMSKTGGKIWGNQRTRSAGVQGAYGQRVIWNNCGSGRNMVPELVATDPVAWRWLDLIADVRRAAA
jgi:hypothetical protein